MKIPDRRDTEGVVPDVVDSEGQDIQPINFCCCLQLAISLSPLFFLLITAFYSALSPSHLDNICRFTVYLYPKQP